MTRLNNIDFSNLTRDECLWLAHQLLEHAIVADCPLTDEQLAGMHRRAAALASGEDPGIPWEDVCAKYLPSSQ